jgi:hypothetical protein
MMVAAGLAAAAFGSSPVAAAVAPPSEDGIYAAYVLLAEDAADGTMPLARVIVAAGRACPTLASKQGPLAMVARRNPNPATFPVGVCEARYPFGEAVTVTGTELRLPVVGRKPRRIIVLGDTGCAGGGTQDCDDPAAWPFAAFAAAAAKDAPDLVIHLGDYNYRGTPGTIEVHGQPQAVYDAGDNTPDDPRCQLQAPYVSQNAAGSSVPDSWEAWRADFFAPAAPLLARAPWVLVRGNHDLCSRAGPGYFYFLDPHSGVLGGEQLGCPAQQNGGSPLPNLVFVPPYRLDLGGLNLVVLDSANACDLYPNFAAAYAQQFAAVRQLAATGPTWLVGHRPLWAVNRGGSGTGAGVQVINVSLQRALRRSGTDGSLPRAVQLVLAGHMHRFEAVTFASGRPPQLVVGDSGVAITGDPLSGAFAATVDGQPAKGLAVNAFGYLDVQLGRSGRWWWGKVVNPLLPGPGPEALAVCGSLLPAIAGRVCLPVPDLSALAD